MLIEIPLGAVVLEELAFRGVLLGLLRRMARPAVALVWSSVLFGCWHVLTALGVRVAPASLPEPRRSDAGARRDELGGVRRRVDARALGPGSSGASIDPPTAGDATVETNTVFGVGAVVTA